MKYPTFDTPHDALNAVGIDPGKYGGLDLIPNKIKRVGTLNKPHSKDGYVIPFIGGNFLCGNWSGEQRAVYCQGGNKLSKEELQKVRNNAEKAYQMLLRERENEYSATAKKAMKFWTHSNALDLGISHPYLIAKQIEPVPTIKESTAEQFKKFFGYSLKENNDKETLAKGRILIIPLGTNDTLASLQIITETGAKHFLSGGKCKNCYWLTEKQRNKKFEYIAIAEGMATVLSVIQHNKFCMNGVVIPKEKVLGVAGMSANNLPGIAQIFRKKYPNATIVILGDNDKSGTGQRKAREAQLSINGKSTVQIPKFSDREKQLFKRITGTKKDPSDWADKYLITNILVKERENER